jgi:hypothetical protein
MLIAVLRFRGGGRSRVAVLPQPAVPAPSTGHYSSAFHARAASQRPLRTGFFTDQYDRGMEFVGWLPRGGDGRHHKDLTPKR